MTQSPEQDGVLIGGPRDGTLFTSEDVAVVELEIDDFVHRYIRTTRTRERDGRTYTVYNYDGEIDPDGAMPGVETR